MIASLREAGWRRARYRCEYCLLPEAHAAVVPFQIEHIIACQHGGPTVLANLALACHHCNLSKGPNLIGIDPRARAFVRLFHPRRMKWERHFQWDGPRIIGCTPIGRATVAVLQMNHPDRIDVRQALIREGIFP